MEDGDDLALPADHADPVLERGLLVLCHRLRVPAGAEGVFGPREQQAADGFVPRDAVDQRTQERAQVVAQGIAIVRVVQRDDGDAVFDAAEQLRRAGLLIATLRVHPRLPSALNGAQRRRYFGSRP